MKPTTMDAAAGFALPHGRDRQHSAEHQHEGAEELVEEVVHAVVVRVGGAEGAEDGFGIVGVLVVRQVGDVHDELARHCAEQLGDDVRQDLVPREHAVDGLREVMAG